MHEHIILTGGGSLGPVTPLLAVGRALRSLSADVRVSWIGTRSGPEKRLVEEAGVPFHAISSGKLRRYFDWQNFVDAFRILAGFFQAVALLRRLKADAVVTAGGFVAVPVVWAARLLRLPVHVHQQDVLPGLANKLSLPVAASVSVALESSLKDFAARNPKWTGNPVRPEVLAGSAEQGVRAFGLEAGVPTLLVLGGGTGAASLNAAVRAALPALLPHVQVIHSTGAGKNDASVQAPRYHQYELITKDMPHAFAAADLVVTRAGMGTLTELAALGKPIVIVPMPKSHQEDNARAFAAASVVLKQEQLGAETFGPLLLGLLADAPRRSELGRALRAMHKSGAADAIAATVLGMAMKRNARLREAGRQA